MFVFVLVTDITEERDEVWRWLSPFYSDSEARSQRDLGGDDGEPQESVGHGNRRRGGGIKMMRRALSIHLGRGVETDGRGGDTPTPPLMGYPFSPSGRLPPPPLAAAGMVWVRVGISRAGIKRRKPTGCPGVEEGDGQGVASMQHARCWLLASMGGAAAANM